MSHAAARQKLYERRSQTAEKCRRESTSRACRCPFRPTGYAGPLSPPLSKFGHYKKRPNLPGEPPLTGFGLPASFGPLPARSASTAPDWECVHRLLITVHRPGLAPTPPDLECDLEQRVNGIVIFFCPLSRAHTAARSRSPFFITTPSAALSLKRVAAFPLCRCPTGKNPRASPLRHRPPPSTLVTNVTYLTHLTSFPFYA